MKKKRLYGYVNDFSVNYDSIDIADILDITMFGFIKKCLLD